jgi:hypothetical protein
MRQAFDSPWTALAGGMVLTALLYQLAQRLVPHALG